MAFARMPGGGRFNDETRFFAMVFVSIFLGVFFLLVARNEWDKLHGKKLPELRPVKNAGAVIRSTLER